ncbi:protein of unknown function [Methylorubrum extorquens]|uniref:Uncharacterized protein n=1 Tax=Methylorubrum extorquens TaxID=408 RepID=A0A2N9AK24_METEX|nr:protein of unknown function [Methylorubrum extorquens]
MLNMRTAIGKFLSRDYPILANIILSRRFDQELIPENPRRAINYELNTPFGLSTMRYRQNTFVIYRAAAESYRTTLRSPGQN